MRKSPVVTLALCIPLTLATLVGAMAEESGSEPLEAATTEVVTKDELAEAITTWVKAESEAHDGHLAVDDAETGETVLLTLDFVHRERLSRTADQTYFACADFVADDGTRYDVDIFMEGPNKDSLETTEVTVHKVDDVARYGWYEEDGVWKKRPVEG